MTAPPDYVWGVDVATTKIAFAFMRLSDRKVQANSVAIPKTTSAKLPDRLVDTLRRTSEFVDAMQHHFPPLAVLVEQPAGKWPAPTLVAAWGTTLTALRTELPNGLLIYTLTPTKWKASLGLRGGCGKDDLMAHAHGLGYTGDDQDEADAICLADTCAQSLTSVGRAA